MCVSIFDIQEHTHIHLLKIYSYRAFKEICTWLKNRCVLSWSVSHPFSGVLRCNWHTHAMSQSYSIWVNLSRWTQQINMNITKQDAPNPRAYSLGHTLVELLTRYLPLPLWTNRLLQVPKYQDTNRGNTGWNAIDEHWVIWEGSCCETLLKTTNSKVTHCMVHRF